MSTFQKMVQGNQTLEKRQAEASEILIAKVQEAYGVELSSADVSEFECMKAYVLGAIPIDGDDWRKDAQTVTSVKAKIKSEQLRASIQSRDADPQSRAEMLELLDSMSLTERLAYARENNISSPTDKPVTSQDTSTNGEDRDALVEEASRLNPSMRMAFCRKHGIL